MLWVPCEIVKLRLTGVAALNDVLPAWSASTVHVPMLVMVRLPPAREQFPDVAAAMASVTVNPELAVADTPKDTGRIARLASAAKVIVCEAFCTVSVNDCIELPAPLVAVKVKG